MVVVKNDCLELVRERIENLGRSSSPPVNEPRWSRFQPAIFSSLAIFLVWIPLTLLLVWAIITNSIGAYLADARPEMAIQLSPTNSRALLNLAEAELKRAQADLGAST